MIDDAIHRARAQGRGALDEASAKALLSQYGVTVPKGRVVKGAEDVDAALDGLAFPVVVKVVSPQIVRKSDAGGVTLGLRSADNVRLAIRAMAAVPQIAASSVDGWLVEEMVPAGQEMVIGGLCDADFGPLVMLGLGGIVVEVRGGASFRLCPITRVDAAEMIDDLKGPAILDRACGRPPMSREAIVDVLLKFGGDDGLLMQHVGQISVADIDPLIVSAHGAVAVDARFRLA
jgi:succinyl-CoA synthetase beta subunit